MQIPHRPREEVILVNRQRSGENCVGVFDVGGVKPSLVISANHPSAGANMTKIIAICPYCRRGGVRARTNAIGSIAHCPKCKSNFTILPEDNLPDWAVNAKPEAESFYQSSSPLAETRATAKLPDRTEPSPTVRADPKPKAKAPEEPKPAPEQPPTPQADAAHTSPPATPQAAPENETEESPPRAPADTAMVIALLMLALVGPTVLVSQLSPGRFIATPLAVVGLLGGLLCLGAEGRARLVAAVAAFLHFGLLIVLLCLPSWLNLESWQGSPAQEQKVPMAVPNAGGPALPADWVDGAKASWVYDDVRVSVRGASLGPIELVGPKGARRKTTESYLQLSLRITNAGVERRIPLSEWATGTLSKGVRLTDATGKEIPVKAFPAGWAPEQERSVQSGLFPGNSTDVLIAFAAPTAKGTYQLELSGAGVGGSQPVRFRLASEFLGVRP